jgi:two-component system, OmpR family, sensor histidine kinase TctE
MSDGGSAPSSIRRRLLVYLSGTLLLMIVGAAVVTYWAAVRSADDAYDRSLLDPVLDIADNIQIDATGARVDLPQKALEALVYDHLDTVIFQVRSEGGAIIDGDSELPAPPAIAPGEHRFFDGIHRGARIRLVAYRAPNGFVVQVGETLHKRSRLVREILLEELVPTLLIAAASIGLVWWGVARGLRPLAHVRTELLSRSARDLRPIEGPPAPVEIAPVVDAFNDLLHQLRESNMMQQRFLANAAHQLRTPLAGLQMHLELLLRRELAPEVRSEVERLHGAAIRASRLANQLLALAKAESPPDYLSPLVPVDLGAVAEGAARDWPAKAIARNVDLGFAIAPTSIRGDPLLLAEMLNNLIDNALRYTPAGGAVTVGTGVRDGLPCIWVEDNGPGIAAQERDKVFERFYRITGTEGEGSGLGLAIVKEIVDRHSGTIAIERRDEHGGTRIRISIPLGTETQ